MSTAVFRGYSTESVDSDTSNIEAELDSVRPRLRNCSCASNMKRINRESITDSFQIRPDDPIPEIPTGGARIKVKVVVMMIMMVVVVVMYGDNGAGVMVIL